MSYEMQSEVGQDCLLCGSCESLMKIAPESQEQCVMNFCKLFRIDGYSKEIRNTIRDSFYCLSCRSELQLVSEFYHVIDETLVKLRGVALLWETKFRTCIDDIDSAFPDQGYEEEDYDMHFGEIIRRKQLLTCMKLQRDDMEVEEDQALPFFVEGNGHYMNDKETQTDYEIVTESMQALEKLPEHRNVSFSPLSSEQLQEENIESKIFSGLPFFCSDHNYAHSNAIISNFNTENETEAKLESVILKERTKESEMEEINRKKLFDEGDGESKADHIPETDIALSGDAEHIVKSRMAEWKSKFKLKDLSISLERLNYDVPISTQRANYPFCCDHGCEKCLSFTNFSMDQNSDKNLTPFECPYPGCHKKFRTVENLRTHRSDRSNHKNITQSKMTTRQQNKERSETRKINVDKRKCQNSAEGNIRKRRKQLVQSSKLSSSILVGKRTTRSKAIKAVCQSKKNEETAKSQNVPLKAEDVDSIPVKNEVAADDEDDKSNDSKLLKCPELDCGGSENNLKPKKISQKRSSAPTSKLRHEPVSKISEASKSETAPISPSVLSPASPEPEINTNEDVISLIEWLNLEKQKNTLNPDSNSIEMETERGNIILLEPDPALIPIENFVINAENPVTCRLCRAKLESVWKVRNHVENCWLHNKGQHVYCFKCGKELVTRSALRQHNKYVHLNDASRAACASESTILDKTKNRDHDTLNEEISSLPLHQWLLIEKAKRNNVIRLEPDPSSESEYPEAVTLTFQVSEASPIKCKLCQRLLVSESLVKNHVQTCWQFNKAKHLYCVPCDKVFKDTRRYQFHNILGKHKVNSNLNKSSENSIFTCNRCLMQFSSKSELKYHENSFEVFRSNKMGPKVFKKYPHPTNVIDWKTDTNLYEWLSFQRQLVFSDGSENVILLDPEPKEGENTEINDDHPISCQLCLQKFVNMTTLKTHLVACWSHEEEKHRYCFKCKKLFPNPKKLQDHKNTTKEHLEDLEISGYRCKICRKEFENEKICLEHKESHYHSDGSLKFFVCQLCDKTFSAKNYLYTHMNCHSAYKPYKCPHCPYTTRTKILIKKHQLKHGRVTDYLCKICGKSFTYTQELRDHETSHTDPRPFKCPFEHCSKSFSTQVSLRCHKRIKHLEELGFTNDEFLCATCGQTFGTQWLLNSHVRTKHLHILYKHNNTSIIKCTHEGCPKLFTARHALREHMNSVHTGEKPFQCEECGKAFPFSGSLWKHRKRHNGTIKQTPCPLCPMMFEGNWELKKHLKLHEEGGSEKFKCRFCRLGFNSKSNLKKHEKIHNKDKDKCETEADVGPEAEAEIEIKTGSDRDENIGNVNAITEGVEVEVIGDGGECSEVTFIFI